MRRHTITGMVLGAVCTVALAATCLVTGTPQASDELLAAGQGAAVVEQSRDVDAQGAASFPGSGEGTMIPDGDRETGSVAQADADEGVAPSDVIYDAASVLVRVSEGSTSAEVSRALSSVDGVVAHEVSDDELAAGFVKVELAEGITVEQAVSDLGDVGGAIDGAQPDFAYQLLDVENEPNADGTDTTKGAGLEALSTSLNDTRAESQWALPSLHAYEAWDTARAASPATGSAVTVAVLDAGFDIAHEDLAANIVAPYNAHTRSTTAAALSGLSHGTHVAGIVSAVANNSVGVAGVSYNAHVMPIKVTDESGLAYTSDLVRAYSYLITNADACNVRVVNISMGGSGMAFRLDDAFLRKIDEAYAAGIVTVAAAGNASSSVAVPYDCYPADYDTVVSVMNLQQSGSGVTLAASSNRNRSGETDKNIAAPGTSIVSTLPNNGYGSLSGTSMASPFVAGVLALEFAANPSLTAAEAKNVLYASAQDLGAAGFDPTYGYGEADAAAAVKMARQMADSAREAERRAAEDAARKAEEESQRQIAQVRSLITALPSVDVVTVAHKGQVEEARAAYNALSQAQHASVDASKLFAAEMRIAELERLAREQEAAEAARKAAEEEAARKAAEEEAARKAAAEEAGRKAAAAAEAERKAAEAQLKVDEARRLIDSIPETSKLTLAHRVLVTAARRACDALDAEQSVSLNITKLVAAERRIAELEQLAREQVPSVSYAARAQLLGWLFSASDGVTAGLPGRGMLSELSAVKLSLSGQQATGSIQYRAYVQGVGWERWASNGAVSGTSSMMRGISAMQVKLTGDLADSFDVCYRGYSKGSGWTSWMRDGATAGKAANSSVYKLQAIQVKVVLKDASA